jgi:hypothetical protein
MKSAALTPTDKGDTSHGIGNRDQAEPAGKRRPPAACTSGLLADSKPLRQKLVNTYYDTPDRRLQRKRVAVRYRQKGTEWLLTVKSDAPSPGGLAQRSEWEAPGQPGDFDFSRTSTTRSCAAFSNR